MGSTLVAPFLHILLIFICCTVNSSPVKHLKCHGDGFQCDGGVCIERGKVCDGTWDCAKGQDENGCSMQGIFINEGNKKTVRFPVYKSTSGFDIYLRFTATKCTGQLLEITSRDTKQFLRMTLLEVGPIRVSFNTMRGKGQLDLNMPKKGSFCDGKRHAFTLNIYRGVVFYNADRSAFTRFYVYRLAAPFSSPDRIVLGKGLQGCISGSTVINRHNKTEEHVVGTSAGCFVKKTTVRPTTVPPTIRPAFTYNVMARKIAMSTASAKPKCEPLTFLACKGLGYSVTQVPNILQHSTSHQASTELSTLLSKVRSSCSPHLIPFLCQLFFPPCVLPQAPTPPCRSLCESVQEDCPLIALTNSSHISCKRFPRADGKVECFLGSSKTTAKRTTLLRGSHVEENLTETNSLKQAKGYPKIPIAFTKSVPTTTTPVHARLKEHQINKTRIANTNNTTPFQSNFTTVLPSPSQTGVCGGILASPTGRLMSPGYPAGYPSNTTCRWVIALPNDYHVIRFTFHQVYLEEDRNCVYDYIAVYDLLDNQVGQRYCGSITSPIHKDVKGNVAVMVFRSDSSNSKKGFTVSYEARKCVTSSEVDN